MSMFNTGDILETIEMFTQDNLDVRTVTMGISLLDCIDPDPKKACENIYNKITTKAANLVPAVEHISAEYGIPIINKRISVTPIAMLLGACPEADPVDFAKTLDAAGKKVGVNFVGGYSALVHKGFSAGDRRLIESIPRALAETDIVCSSVNIGATKAGLNMDAIKLMGEAVKKASELTADRQCIGAAKLVVFCNAPEDNPFMAGAFHGIGEPETVINVGVSGPGVVKKAIDRAVRRRGEQVSITEIAEIIKTTAFKVTKVGQLIGTEVAEKMNLPFGVADLSLAPTPEVGDSVGEIFQSVGLSSIGAPGSTAVLAMLNDAVKKGGNRQELHEKLRVHSQAAARVVKEEGGKNDLIDRICADPAFMITREEVEAILRPEQFTGRSCEQVEEYLRDVIRPLLAENADLLGEKQELSV